MTAHQPQPYANTRQDSPIRFLGIPTVVRSGGDTTGGAFTLLEHLSIPPGFATPHHVHRLEDEAFYILEGEVAFLCNGQWSIAGPGAYVFGPRNIPHGFRVEGPAPASMLLLCAPAGFERFVLELSEPVTAPPAPPDTARLMALAEQFSIEILGPLPERDRDAPRIGTSAADNRTAVARWIQAFNRRDWQAESGLRSADFQAHVPGSPQPLNGDAWAAFLASVVAGFPDASIVIDAVVAEHDNVVARWTLTGTHGGTFQGVPPTGNAVTTSGVEISRFVDGRIAEHWAQFDALGVLQQIGALPAQAE